MAPCVFLFAVLSLFSTGLAVIMPPGYEKTYSPTLMIDNATREEYYADATRVFTMFRINRVISVTDLTQMTMIDFELTYAYFDERLMSLQNDDGTNFAVDISKLESSFWSPSLIFPTSIDASRRSTTISVYPLFNGLYIAVGQWKGTFHTEINMARFPFDSQEFRIPIESSHTPDFDTTTFLDFGSFTSVLDLFRAYDLEGIPEENPALVMRLEEPTFRFENPRFELAVAKDSMFTKNQFVFIVDAIRLSGMFVILFILPLFLLGFVSWFSYFFGFQPFRMRVALTGVLGGMMFLAAITLKLPPVNYITLLTFLTFFTLFFAVWNLLMTIAALVINEKMKTPGGMDKNTKANTENTTRIVALFEQYIQRKEQFDWLKKTKGEMVPIGTIPILEELQVEKDPPSFKKWPKWRILLWALTTREKKFKFLEDQAKTNIMELASKANFWGRWIFYTIYWIVVLIAVIVA